MKLDAESVDIGTETPTVLLNQDDAEELGANPLDRILIEWEGGTQTGIVEVTEELVDRGFLGITERLEFIDGETEVSLAPKPDSVNYIRQKLDDEELEKDEIEAIVSDIHHNRLNDVELGAYVSAIYTNGLSMEETINLTESMTQVGERLEWDNDVVADKHSIGGVPGNRVTPIVVPIVAAAGIKIPKTSSRAITSPAGTADTVEVFCDVEFPLEEIKDIVNTTNGCMVWGGSVDISPVDDKVVRAEHPLSLDPEDQVLASVLSKKKAAGSSHVVVDIPYGEGSKVQNLTKARELAHDFKRVGSHLEMEIECTITRGSQPIGRGIGPALEARDILSVLEGEDEPQDLRLKSVRVADILLEICGSDVSARGILESGKALEKFREIIEAQNGNPDITAEDLDTGKHAYKITADRDGVVTDVVNSHVNEIARRAGAPNDKGAGIVLEEGVGSEVREDDVLFVIHAEKEGKLEEAKKLEREVNAVRVGSEEEALVERV